MYKVALISHSNNTLKSFFFHRLFPGSSKRRRRRRIRGCLSFCFILLSPSPSFPSTRRQYTSFPCEAISIWACGLTNFTQLLFFLTTPLFSITVFWLLMNLCTLFHSPSPSSPRTNKYACVVDSVSSSIFIMRALLVGVCGSLHVLKRRLLSPCNFQR